MWEQLAAADPSLKYDEDIELFSKYKDHHRFMQFMKGLRKDLNLLELLSLVALLFLHLMLLSRNLSLKRIDILTITYPLRMLFWLLLILRRLLLIDLIVIASSVKIQTMTSLSIIASKALTKRDIISLMVSFVFHKQPL